VVQARDSTRPFSTSSIMRHARDIPHPDLWISAHPFVHQSQREAKDRIIFDPSIKKPLDLFSQTVIAYLPKGLSQTIVLRLGRTRREPIVRSPREEARWNGRSTDVIRRRRDIPGMRKRGSQAGPPLGNFFSPWIGLYSSIFLVRVGPVSVNLSLSDVDLIRRSLAMYICLT
jgi:hypothetical protein